MRRAIVGTRPAAVRLADWNTVGGVVRAWDAQKATGVRLIAGARLMLDDGRGLLLYPTDRAAWSRLTRLLTLGKSRVGKGGCDLGWSDVAAHGEGQLAILLVDQPDDDLIAWLGELHEAFGRRGHLALSFRRRPDDHARLRALANLARHAGVRCVATGDILYHSPEARLLQDVVTAIREKATIDALGFRRERHADRHLKAPAEMERRFAPFPDAIQATADIAAACRFDLGELSYQYPHERVIEGKSAQQALATLTAEAAERMFPDGVPDAHRDQIAHELRLIEDLGYAPYFLTVNAIVAESRRRGILCQGRGSAANSCVCFVLGITSIDPIRHELLFERFVSGERREPPDIDVDFEHERREEIIQWIYETYGRDRAALTAVVQRYRARGAVRDVGKALGLPEDLTKALAGLVWGWSVEGVGERHLDQLNLNKGDYRLRLTLDLARKLIGTPRHMSQHPGGFVLTHDRLDDLVPIEPARMADRQIIGWDKDDIDALKFMKVDVLGLGMLGSMNRAFNLLAEAKGVRVGMADLQDDDPGVYAMIQKADTLGTFQIESRAQMAMLPRMKPQRFYDLTIEVAIVRPGPIQGDMVHPYLRRREGLEKPEYPRPELRAVLEKTLGVPLFQEQAMKVAIVGAGFTPAEADQLRRAMATFTGVVIGHRDDPAASAPGRGPFPDRSRPKRGLSHLPQRRVKWDQRVHPSVRRLSGVIEDHLACAGIARANKQSILLAGGAVLICNLYNLKVSRWELLAYYKAHDAWREDMEKEYVSPGRPGVVITAGEDGRELRGMRWGFPPPQGVKAPVVNVRNYSSPFWRSALANPERRCLVPVTEFQEWSVEPNPVTGKKRPHWFSVPSRPIFTFAGVWRPTEKGPAFAFLTCGYDGDASAHVVGAIHPKAVPVILHDEDYDRWLTAPIEDALTVACAYPSQLMAVS